MFGLSRPPPRASARAPPRASFDSTFAKVFEVALASIRHLARRLALAR
jgi:hypothetical protein